MIGHNGVVVCTIALVFSNVMFLPSVVESFYQNEYVLAVSLIIVTITSSLYHLCQSGDVCLFPNHVMRWCDHIAVYSALFWVLVFFFRVKTREKMALYLVFEFAAIPLILFSVDSWWVIIYAGAFFLFVMILFFNRVFEKWPDIIDLTMALVVILGGLTLFYLSGGLYSLNYPVYHSYWHVAIALGAYFLIETRVKREWWQKVADLFRRKKKKLKANNV